MTVTVFVKEDRYIKKRNAHIVIWSSSLVIPTMPRSNNRTPSRNVCWTYCKTSHIRNHMHLHQLERLRNQYPNFQAMSLMSREKKSSSFLFTSSFYILYQGYSMINFLIGRKVQTWEYVATFVLLCNVWSLSRWRLVSGHHGPLIW